MQLMNYMVDKLIYKELNKMLQQEYKIDEYGKEILLNKLPIYQSGGEMIKTVSFKKTTYADIPHKFEAGTPNISGVVAFKAALNFITNLGIENIAKHEDQLVQYATEQLSTISGMQFIGEAKKKAALVSFNIKGLHP